MQNMGMKERSIVLEPFFLDSVRMIALSAEMIEHGLLVPFQASLYTIRAVRSSRAVLNLDNGSLLCV